jgi:cytochrome P450
VIPEPADEFAKSLGALALEFLRNPARREEWRDFYDLFHRVPPLPIGDGEWVVTRWPDVRATMGHNSAELTALFPSTSIPEVNKLMLGMLPHESGSEHRRMRALTQPLFKEGRLSGLEPEIVRQVESLLYPAAFTEVGSDIVGTLGVRVPEILSCLLLDVAPEDRGAVGNWSRTLYRQMGRYDQSASETDAARAAYYGIRDYVLRRARMPSGPVYGGVGRELFGAWEGGRLDDDQLLSYFALFLLTGLDTITYAIANSVCFLGSSPQVFSRLRQSPDLSGVAFSEAMRLWGPIRLCVRHLQKEVPTPSCTIPEGALVFILIHAANRDPECVADPDQVRWDRSGRESMAFGIGPHGCLGGALGMLVGRILFRSLCTRCTRIRVTPDLGRASFIPSLPILGIEDVRLYAEPVG